MKKPPKAGAAAEADDNVREFDGERRSNKRRTLFDRRQQEYHRRLIMRILPTLVAVVASAVVSWGVYVTHLTYNINATYDKIFNAHIESQAEKDTETELHFAMVHQEFTAKITDLRTEMNQGLAEIRNSFRDIYMLLVNSRRTPPPPAAVDPLGDAQKYPIKETP